jgi:signal peptidase II
MTAEHLAATLNRPSLGDRIRARWRMDLLFFAIAGVIVTADQLTKWAVRSNLAVGESWPHNGGMIKIVHVVNSGAAFGILQGQTPFLIVTSLLGLGAILLYYIYPPMDHGLVRLALGMQLGGAIGNLIDRARLGEVTDFVHVGAWPVFNVADASISVSIVAVLLFFGLQDFERAREAKPADDGGSDARRDG